MAIVENRQKILAVLEEVSKITGFKPDEVYVGTYEEQLEDLEDHPKVAKVSYIEGGRHFIGGFCIETEELELKDQNGAFALDNSVPKKAPLGRIKINIKQAKVDVGIDCSKPYLTMENDNAKQGQAHPHCVQEDTPYLGETLTPELGARWKEQDLVSLLELLLLFLGVFDPKNSASALFWLTPGKSTKEVLESQRDKNKARIAAILEDVKEEQFEQPKPDHGHVVNPNPFIVPAIKKTTTTTKYKYGKRTFTIKNNKAVFKDPKEQK